MKEAYPLCWPMGYKRTACRINSKFKQTMERAQKALQFEINMLGGKDLLVSTNIPVRNDGLLYADWMRRKLDDPGVAIYFKYKGKEISMCCDQYRSVWENIYALAKGIEALRGMERWGVSDFLDRAFTGFAALPESPTKRPWYEILRVSPSATQDEIKIQWKKLLHEHHPDKGGSRIMFDEIQAAYEQSKNNQS